MKFDAEGKQDRQLTQIPVWMRSRMFFGDRSVLKPENL